MLLLLQRIRRLRQRRNTTDNGIWVSSDQPAGRNGLYCNRIRMSKCSSNLFNTLALLQLLAIIIWPISNTRALVVEPPVLFLDEDWPVGKRLDVRICRDDDNEAVEVNELRMVRQLSPGTGPNSGPDMFNVFPLNSTCWTLVLKGALEADRVFPSDAAADDDLALPDPDGSSADPFGGDAHSAASPSFTLQFEQARQRAMLQVQLVDVNDCTPRFLGGPFPAELVIPEDSAPGTLIRRLQVFDPDGGIGGVCRFTLVTGPDSNPDPYFSLHAQQCRWPRCSAELRLRRELPARAGPQRVRVQARDGAGLTTKRANQASVLLTVSAVPHAEAEGNRADLNSSNLTESLLPPETDDDDDMDRPLASSNALNLRTTTNPLPDEDASVTHLNWLNILNLTSPAPLITFDPSRNHGDVETNTTTSSSFSSSTTKKMAELRNFVVHALSEDAPVGLELLRIELPHNQPVRFVELTPGGMHALRMDADGAVRVDAPLDARVTRELVAEVRADAEQPLAHIRVHVQPMMERFREWLTQAVTAADGRVPDTEVRPIDARWYRVLDVPEELRTYASVHGNGMQLTRAGVVGVAGDVDADGGERCFDLQLQYRDDIVRKHVCVRLPHRAWRLQLRWPANGSHHTFRENEGVPYDAVLCPDVRVLYPSMGSLHFEIEDSDDSDAFTIDASTGQIALRPPERTFDFERRSTYTLAVSACVEWRARRDGCMRVLWHIDVQDANDNCPEFEPSMEDGANQTDAFQMQLSIPEDRRTDLQEPLARLPAARDADGTEEWRSVCYRLEATVNGTLQHNHPFVLLKADKPGLYLAKALDYESVRAYTLHVFAEDCAWTMPKCTRTASSPPAPPFRVHVNVTDVNDNAPRFTRRHFFAPLVLHTGVPRRGDALAILRAHDPDACDRGRLRFGWADRTVQTEPIAVGSVPFRLNRTSGELSLRADADDDERELRAGAAYTMRVRVRDSGVHAHEDEASVTVCVLEARVHLLPLTLGVDSVTLVDAELALFEQLLSIASALRAMSARQSRCGGANCTLVDAYFLDTLAWRPLHASYALKMLRAVGHDDGERARAMRALQDRYGVQLPAEEAGVRVVRVQRSALLAVAAFLLAVTCILLFCACRCVRQKRAQRRKAAAHVRASLYASDPWGISGIAKPEYCNGGSSIPAPAAAMGSFGAVRMYGASGTSSTCTNSTRSNILQQPLSIPRVMNNVSTEF